jgi:hemoglobin
MAAQIKKQVAFMSWAFGGPVEYRGRDLTAAHAHLVKAKGLNDTHFDAVAGCLKETLLELGVEASLIGEVLQLVNTTRAAVLGRPQPA